MQFPFPLVRGRLKQRYKRFLADVVLDSGEHITAACPNTGAMVGLTAPGSVVWLSKSEAATRKYPHTWEMVEADIGGTPDPRRHQSHAAQPSRRRGHRGQAPSNRWPATAACAAR